jgi:hypothetical protein
VIGRHVSASHCPAEPLRESLNLALQLQGAFEVRLLRHRLVTSSPDGPGDDERRLDPALR